MSFCNRRASRNLHRFHMIRYFKFPRSARSETPKVDHVSCAFDAREDNTGRDDHSMDGVQHCFLSFGLIQTAIKDEVSTCLTSARSDCVVSGFVIRSVLCSPIPYRNECVVRLMFRRQHVEHYKQKLGCNNTSVQPTTKASSLSNNSWAEN